MIRYILEEIGLNGARDQRIEDFDKDEIVVGRGSAADLRLESRYVSLNHAKFTVSGGNFSVQDLGSISGLQVNDKVVTAQVLQVDDNVRLGDVVLRVSCDEGCWGLVERRRQGEVSDLDSQVAKDLERLSLVGGVLSVKFWSLVLVALILGFFLIVPLLGRDQHSWSSGPISSGHAMIAHDCASCHTGAFNTVSDQQCTACHNLGEHAESFVTHERTLNIPCANCHMEHNGNHGIITSQSRLCVSCHANLKAVLPQATRADFASFEEHTEFFVRMQPPKPGDEFTRVRLDDPKLRDNSNIKLNHQVHLKEGLKGAEGPVTMACSDCHKLSANFRTIEKISFDKNCRSCHGLEFDERLAGKQVPHGDTDVVYKFLYAEYAKLFLAAKDDPALQKKFDIRMRLGESAPTSDAGSEAEFTRAFVEKESRTAEKQLFTKTACQLCHRVTESGKSDKEAQAQAVSKFEIFKPQIPERWMPASTFSHGAHEEVRCEECHSGVRESKLTVQVLLPKVKQCKECHSGHVEAGKVKSDCIMCHSFHDSLTMSLEKKRTVGEIVGN